VEKMKKMVNGKDEETALEMARSEVTNTADALCQQKDRNRPKNTGSCADFLNTVRKGRESLEKQGNYCKVQQ
jgi:hypothetical protein